MADIWFISDHHFFHVNILKFTDSKGNRIRPEFNTIEEMHEDMVNKHNSVVKTTDKVYFQGDVTFKYGSEFNSLMSRLNGHKRLLIGNHDRIKGTNLLNWFEKVEMWKFFKEHGFVCSHFPLLKDQFIHKVKANVHGHTHQNIINQPEYINVCCEILKNKPIHLDEIKKIIKDRGL